MTENEFRKLVTAHRIRGAKTIRACRLVLVEGQTAYAASQTAKIDEAAISRALAKLRRPRCPHCGQPMPKKKPRVSSR